MTEYRDSEGNARIRWGTVEWIGSITITILCAIAIGIGGFAWGAIWDNHDTIQELKEDRAGMSEQIENLSYWISDLADSKEVLSAILARLEDINRRLDRLDNKVDSQPNP